MTAARVLAMLGALAVLVALIAALLAPGYELEGPRSPWPSLLAGLGALAFVAAAWLSRGRLRVVLAARQTRFGAFTAAHVAAVLLGLAALAFLAERHALRLDLTRDRRSSLELDTRRVLAAIPPEGSAVALDAFVAGGGLTPVDAAAAAQQLQPLFRLLEEASPRVKTRLLDAAREPVLTRALGIARVPSIAVSYTPAGEESPRVVRTDVLEELSIARAIEEVLAGQRRVAYVLAGHGELEPSQASGGIEAALGALASDNYELRPLLLPDTGRVPEDASLVLLAGPQQDLLEGERDMLGRYFDEGGRLLLLLGPVFERGGGLRELPLLEGWLRERLRLQLGSDVVCELEGLRSGASDLRWLTLRPMDQRAHPIVASLGSLVVFPFARTLAVDAARPSELIVSQLLRSSPQSWAEAETTDRPAYGPDDVRGPHVVGMAFEHAPLGPEKAARVVVFGSHLFATNRVIGLAGNSRLLLDSVAWLTDREDVIAARGHGGRDGTAVIPYQQGILIILCAAAIPFVLACFGVVTWWHRRRL